MSGLSSTNLPMRVQQHWLTGDEQVGLRRQSSLGSLQRQDSYRLIPQGHVIESELYQATPSCMVPLAPGGTGGSVGAAGTGTGSPRRKTSRDSSVGCRDAGPGSSDVMLTPARQRATVLFDTWDGGQLVVSYDAPQQQRSKRREAVQTAIGRKSDIFSRGVLDSGGAAGRDTPATGNNSAAGVNNIGVDTPLNTTTCTLPVVGTQSSTMVTANAAAAAAVASSPDDFGLIAAERQRGDGEEQLGMAQQDKLQLHSESNEPAEEQRPVSRSTRGSCGSFESLELIDDMTSETGTSSTTSRNKATLALDAKGKKTVATRGGAGGKSLTTGLARRQSLNFPPSRRPAAAAADVSKPESGLPPKYRGRAAAAAAPVTAIGPTAAEKNKFSSRQSVSSNSTKPRSMSVSRDKCSTKSTLLRATAASLAKCSGAVTQKLLGRPPRDTSAGAATAAAAAKSGLKQPSVSAQPSESSRISASKVIKPPARGKSSPTLSRRSSARLSLDSLTAADIQKQTAAAGLSAAAGEGEGGRERGRGGTDTTVTATKHVTVASNDQQVKTSKQSTTSRFKIPSRAPPVSLSSSRLPPAAAAAASTAAGRRSTASVTAAATTASVHPRPGAMKKTSSTSSLNSTASTSSGTRTVSDARPAAHRDVFAGIVMQLDDSPATVDSPLSPDGYHDNMPQNVSASGRKMWGGAKLTEGDIVMSSIYHLVCRVEDKAKNLFGNMNVSTTSADVSDLSDTAAAAAALMSPDDPGIPQWKSSDPYLAGILRHLRATDQRLNAVAEMQKLSTSENTTTTAFCECE